MKRRPISSRAKGTKGSEGSISGEGGEDPPVYGNCLIADFSKGPVPLSPALFAKPVTTARNKEGIEPKINSAVSSADRWKRNYTARSGVFVWGGGGTEGFAHSIK